MNTGRSRIGRMAYERYANYALCEKQTHGRCNRNLKRHPQTALPYFNAGTSVGGSNSHTLSVNELAKHNHRYTGASNEHTIALSAYASNSAENVAFGWVNNNQLCFASRPTSGPITANSITGVSSGGNSAHNNMPSYQTLYAWRRTT